MAKNDWKQGQLQWTPAFKCQRYREGYQSN